MASIGRYNTLKVTRETGSGYYLDAGELGEILLPGNVAPQNLRWGSDLEVFVYPDSEDRLVATTERPHATVGEFACLKVLTVHSQIGAFLDWGLGKDLLLPFREQSERVAAGDRAVVYIKLDERTNRVVATTRLNRYLRKSRPDFAPGQAVHFLISHRSPLGYQAIVEGGFSGLLYHSNLGTALEIGQAIDGYVQAVRPDGKLDLSLDAPGPGRVGGLSGQIMEALKKNDGRLPFDDSSTPEAIRDRFNSSKKAFKKALGSLYKQRRIRFSKGGGIEEA